MYLSIDIDVLDPVFGNTLVNCVLMAAPGTGTPENGGWTSRELRTILRGMEGLNVFTFQGTIEILDYWSRYR